MKEGHKVCAIWPPKTKNKTISENTLHIIHRVLSLLLLPFGHRGTVKMLLFSE